MTNKTLMCVVVRGQYFESVRACADHFKIKTGTVYFHLSRGTIDNLGLGRGKNKKAPEGERAGGRPARALTIFGVKYRSQRAASVALGFHPRYVASTISRLGPRKGLQHVVTAYMRKQMDEVARRERGAQREAQARLECHIETNLHIKGMLAA